MLKEPGMISDGGAHRVQEQTKRQRQAGTAGAPAENGWKIAKGTEMMSRSLLEIPWRLRWRPAAGAG